MKKYENGVYMDMTEDEMSETGQYSGFDYGQIVEILIREKYNVSEELAIQRQREEKPAEFSEYYVFCEECKQRAKKITGTEVIEDGEVTGE